MPYELINGITSVIEDDGTRETLANFTAKIVEEIRFVNGRDTETYLTIEGEQQKPDSKKLTEMIKLPPTTIKSDDFAGMSWAMKSWGVRAVIYPGSGVKENLRTAIQMNSRPIVSTVYRHLGWTEIDGHRAYIHGGGAISAKGNDDKVAVQLPPELSRYNLSEGNPNMAAKNALRDSIQASLDLSFIATPETCWPLLAATFAPLFGPVDFAIHLTGKTGTYKSELMSLFQSHYGSGMDARHLPGSWSSTANAIEAQAFIAANAVYVLDDFVPNGTSSQQRSYQQNADKIIRAQGNQAGRARLTDTSALQTAMYPRGIIMSTGEDTPEGHSVRARMMILEMTPGDTKLKPLTDAQRKRSRYPAVTAALVQHLAKNKVDLKDKINEFRDKNIELGHARTPGMVGHLLAVIDYVLNWAASCGVDVGSCHDMAMEAITRAAEKQKQYLESADPCDQFIQAIRQAMVINAAHVRTLNGGIPKGATQLGWTQLPGEDGDLPNFKSNGPCMGWISWTNDEFLLEVNAGFAAVKKQLGTELSLTRQTMLKRLKDSGKLKRIDDQRQRNTVRVTAENHPRQVIVMSISEVLDTQEMLEE